MAPLPLRVIARISDTLFPPSLEPREPPPPASRPSEARALPAALSIPHLRPRQTEAPYVTETYGSVDNSPSPGEIVGIVIGSIAGFLFLLWLVHVCVHNAKPTVVLEGTIASTSGSSLLRHSHRHSSKSHSSRSHHSHKRDSRRKSGVRRRETVEIRTSQNSHPVIIDEPRLRHSNPPVVEVAEHRRRSSGKPIIIPMPPSEPSTESTATEDIIVVQPPPPVRRHSSKRNSGHSQHRRRSSGYREVHPDQFAGGIEPVRDVRRSRGR